MSAIEITSRIRQIKELQQLIEEASAEMEAHKDEIKAHMAARGTEELTVDVFKVRYTPVTSKRFDTTGFKVTHAALYAQYCKESTVKRFQRCVSEKTPCMAILGVVTRRGEIMTCKVFDKECMTGFPWRFFS